VFFIVVASIIERVRLAEQQHEGVTACAFFVILTATERMSRFFASMTISPVRPPGTCAMTSGGLLSGNTGGGQQQERGDFQRHIAAILPRFPALALHQLQYFLLTSVKLQATVCR
jgi:hypothetical protein